MIEKRKIEQGVINMLKVNMGLRGGEKLLVVTDVLTIEEWVKKGSKQLAEMGERSLLARMVSEIAGEKFPGSNVQFYAYPSVGRHGSEPGEEVERTRSQGKRDSRQQRAPTAVAIACRLKVDHAAQTLRPNLGPCAHPPFPAAAPDPSEALDNGSVLATTARRQRPERAACGPGGCEGSKMRLVCPNCAAQYDVDDRVIPEGGRDVQCSNCGHSWFQTPAIAVERPRVRPVGAPPRSAPGPASPPAVPAQGHAPAPRPGPHP